MKKLFHRFLIGLFFALPIVGLVLFLTQISADAQASAQDPQPTTAPQFPGMTYDSCAGCHNEIHESWKHGPHGQALSDPVFAKAWSEQGEPGACLVCHTTGYDPATGPLHRKASAAKRATVRFRRIIPPRTCRWITRPSCAENVTAIPRFESDNWKLSAHYQRDMTCTVCHDQHSAGMKSVAGQTDNLEDASDLCANCHKDAMQNFPTSKHAEAGVTCVNCHLGFNPEESGEGPLTFDDMHKAPDHNFMPSLDTCNKCHADQMHAPGDAVVAAAIKIEEIGGTPTPEPTAAATPVPQVENEPLPVSPLGFAAMAGLLGLAAGMVLAPWLERSYKHLTKGGKND